MPKNEIQGFDFIKNNPNFDGRGVVVAIFDTGCDPGAPGLQVTTDGKPKFIDCVDTTGSGDVDTSATVTVTPEEKTLKGLSGRTLQLGDWANPTGTYHLGLKPAFELFPKSLINRMKKTRKTDWEKESKVSVQMADLHRALSALKDASDKAEKKKKEEIQAQLDELKRLVSNYSDPGPVYDCVVFHDGTHWRAVIDSREDGDLTGAKPMANFSVEYQYQPFSNADLMNYSVNIYDEGSLLSIVTTAGNHGTHVAGIVGAHDPAKPEINGIAPGVQMISVKVGDTRLGSMETGPGLIRGLIACVNNKCDMINMSYGEAASVPNVGRFCALANEVVNEHGVIFVSSAGNAGPMLTTVGAPGGTTTAVISVGAYVSPTMMEAEYSMRKPLPETQYTWSSRGPTCDGDRGVSISACGGAITSVAQWSLNKNQLMNGTSMSSPAACGGIALLVSALKAENRPYSPHSVRRAVENSARDIPTVESLAKGCGLLQVQAAYEYMCNYSGFIDDDIFFKLSVASNRTVGPGRGIYLRDPLEVNQPSDISVGVTPVFKDVPESNLKKIDFEMLLNLTCDSPFVVVPKHFQLNSSTRAFTVRVDPTLSSARGQALGPGMYYSEILAYDNTCPQRGPVFRVPVTILKPEPLPSLAVSASLSRAYHHNSMGNGESKVLTASASNNVYNFSQSFAPSDMFRKYFVIPAGATNVEVTVKGGKNIDTNRAFMFQMGYLKPQTPYRDTRVSRFFRIASDDTIKTSMYVEEGYTFELVIAQYWSTYGNTDMDIEINFHGLVPSSKEVFVNGAEGVKTMSITTPLQTETVKPVAELTHLRQTLRPSATAISPKLPVRDVLPNGKQVYELVNTYDWKAKAKGKVVVRCGTLQNVLYESAFGSQLYQVFDSNKKLVASGDCWPDATQLDKGAYTVKLHVRHDSVAALEKLKTMPVEVESSLGKNISLTVYNSFNGCVTGKGGKFGEKKLKKGQTKAFFINAGSCAAYDKFFPSHVSAGDMLIGEIKYTTDTNIRATHTGAKGYPLRFLVPAKPVDEKKASGKGGKKGGKAAKKKATENAKKEKEAAAAAAAADSEKKEPAQTKGNDDKNGDDQEKEDGEEKEEEYDLAKEMRDVQIDYLSKLKPEKKQLKAFSLIFPSLLDQFPTHLPLLSMRLDVLNKRSDRLKVLSEITEAADAVIAQVDTTSLAAYFGLNQPTDDEEATKEGEEMKKTKKALLAALEAKATAVMDQLKQKVEASDQSNADSNGDCEKEEAKADAVAGVDSADASDEDPLFVSFLAAMKELKKWEKLTTKTNKKKFYDLNIFEDEYRQRWGLVLKALADKIAGAKSDGDGVAPRALLEKRMEILRLLGGEWVKWANLENNNLNANCPKSFRPF